MTERIPANDSACVMCAAKTITSTGAICEPWKLGQRNRISKKRSKVFGIKIGSGTALRPMNCPHPESEVSGTMSPELILRKRLGK